MTRIAKIALILVALFALVAVASANTGDLSSDSNKLATLNEWAKFHGISTFGVTGADLDLYLRADGTRVTGSATSFLSYHPSCAPDTRVGSAAVASFSGKTAEARGRIISTNTYIIDYAGVTRYLCGQ